MVTTTFPRLMLEHAAQRPDAPALREKEFGIWQTLSWSQLATLVRELAGGLAAAGLQRATFELNQKNFTSIKMPNAANFYDDDRETAEKHFWGKKPCMKDCLKQDARVLNRAQVLDVTPDNKTAPRVD